jgi:hypothetical protein
VTYFKYVTPQAAPFDAEGRLVVQAVPVPHVEATDGVVVQAVVGGNLAPRE